MVVYGLYNSSFASCFWFLTGAIGGIAHHPMQAMIDGGASPLGVVAGISKGLFGVVAKPIGATVELVAMTGQGLLQGAGWTPKYEVRAQGSSETIQMKIPILPFGKM